MSSKHLKKLLTEKENEKTISDGQAESDGTEEEEDGGVVNRFAMLTVSDENEHTSADEDLPSPQAAKKNKKKNRKKEKAAKKIVKEKEESDVGKTPEDMATEQGVVYETELSNVQLLFKFDPKIIDPSAELRRNLGRAFRLEGTRDEEGGRNVPKRPSKYVMAKWQWPQIRKLGLSMVLEKREGGLEFFRFVHSHDYRNFEVIVKHSERNHDLDTVMAVLRDCPYQLDSILLAANMFNMQEDVSHAQEFIERGIYACEMSFHALFNASIWTHRMDYLQFENRSFFLLLHRHVLNCEHRRSYATALNFAKLLFSLDPQGDPLGCTLLMDSLAIKAKQMDWVITVFEGCKWKNLHLLPNWMYSMALASFLVGKEEADDLLRSALVAFPTVFSSLTDALQLELDTQTAKCYALTPGARAREKESVHILSKLYAKQTSSLWKAPTVLQWLEKVVRELGSDWGSREEDKEAAADRGRRFAVTAPAINRAAVLGGIGVTESFTLTDPFPPRKGRADYAVQGDEADPSANDNFMLALVHSMYPDFNPGETLTEGMQRMADGMMGAFRAVWQPATGEEQGEQPGDDQEGHAAD